MSSHVKPCQFAQEGNLGVVHMLLQQKALPSGFHWGPKGTRAPRKIISESWELMGTHGKREAGPIFCILWNLRHSFLEDTVSNFVLPLKRLLHSQTHLQEWKVLWFV
jgi:hypothetical protein